MKLFFKKLFTAPLYAFAAFIGIFGWAVVIHPFNLPYLLKLPEESSYIFGCVFSFLFVAVVAMIVRTNRCHKEDVLSADGKPLVLRVLLFRDFHMELIVFALLSMIFLICVGAQTEAALWLLVLGALLLTAGATFVFAILDGLIWMISAKRAYK